MGTNDEGLTGADLDAALVYGLSFDEAKAAGKEWHEAAASKAPGVTQADVVQGPGPLTADDIQAAIAAGLDPAEAQAAKEAGLTWAEATIAQRMGVPMERYAARRSTTAEADNWKEADDAAQQRHMLAELARASHNTPAGERLGKLADEGLPEDYNAPVAWWSAQGAHDAAYERAKAADPVNGYSDLARAEGANAERLRRGLHPNVPIPERLR